ncbi:hypothetical protein LHV18_13665 [Providencia rettgeri]|uniref:hypothetical protein n=1 Tax=Providencia rettgeri TaxID=587 RepID=UPI001CFF33F6|nr:hypothetical protein [Providencia rettgeri]EIU7556593.1 hypothetical protein [Providencia rettgeri]EIU7559645.1 hypothetical protein [Providencia rettgeri]EJD6539365.1 hypothetical protein [Providencia rettgeri]EJD6541780.1 hypothetical protein [Providencia rettgeri]MCB4841678.1 hypothetical protein [Providencia rettgeri]
MSNFFDQFDKQPEQVQDGNYFDQFDNQNNNPTQSAAQQPQQTNDYIRGMVNTNRQLAEGINRSGQQGKDFRDNVIDAVTGESKMTPEIQGLNSVMSSPEIQSLTGDSFKANWAQLFGNDEDFMLTLRNMGGKMSSDEKGNVIVDLPSGKYALNKPGLDGDDIIPFVANALAFTPAARAETIWGSGLASAATDVGLQGSVSAAGGTDVDPLQTAISGGIGVGGKIIERGISGLSRAASGEIAPETQQLLRNAEQNGIDVLTSDVLPPRGLGRQFQQTGEQSIGGTGNRRAIQAEQRRDFVESLPQMIEREFGIYAPHVMQGEVRAGLRAAKDQHGGVINRITEQMGDAALVPNRSVNVLDGAIRQLENRLNPNQNAIQTLTRLRDRLVNGESFAEWRNLRTQLREDLQGDALAMPTNLDTMYQTVNRAMTSDMNTSVANSLGGATLNQLRNANNAYRVIARGIEKTGLKNALEKGDVTPELINNLVYSKRPSDIARIYGMVNENGRNQLRAAYLTKAYEKANGSPQTMVTQLNQLINQSNGQIFNTVFNPRQRQIVEGIRDVLEATERASTANAVTQTGMSLLTPTRIASGLLTGGIATTIEGGMGLIARMYESPRIRNMLLRMHNTPRGSTARDRAITNIINTLSATGQSEVRN